MTVDSLIAEMDKALQFPGVSNAWTMPIKARIDMLSTGIRTPVGVKVFGTDLAEIDRLAQADRAGAEDRARHVVAPTPSAASAATTSTSTPDRAALARYGLMVQDVQDTIATALGGETVTTTVEGRERFTVNMRYPRDLRDNPQAIASDVLVPMPAGGAVPLGEVAKVAAGARADLDPHRERAAGDLHLRRHPRPRPRRLCRRRAARGGGQHPVPAGLLRDVERPVRISRTRRRRG